MDRERCRHKPSERQEITEGHMEQTIINCTNRIKAKNKYIHGTDKIENTPLQMGRVMYRKGGNKSFVVSQLLNSLLA